MIDPGRLKRELKPLSDGKAPHSTTEKAYFRYYGLQPEEQFANISHRFGYVDSCDYRIVGHLFQQPEAKGTWFVLHGYYDHSGLMTNIIHFFLEQGFDVLVFDLPGHGLSSGQPATIPDFSVYSLILEDLYNYCRSFITTPVHAFGQSTGGAIITDFLLEKSRLKQALLFDQLVLSAPLIRPYLWALSRFQFYLVRPFLRQVPRKFTNNSRDEAFLKKAHEDVLTARVLPTQWVASLDRWIRRIESSPININRTPLIIQGTQDTTVDANYNIAQLQKLYNNPNVLWLENARHHLPNELKETRDFYTHWLAENIND